MFARRPRRRRPLHGRRARRSSPRTRSASSAASRIFVHCASPQRQETQTTLAGDLGAVARDARGQPGCRVRDRAEARQAHGGKEDQGTHADHHVAARRVAAQPAALQRREGRADHAGEGAGARPRPARHPRQRHRRPARSPAKASRGCPAWRRPFRSAASARRPMSRRWRSRYSPSGSAPTSPGLPSWSTAASRSTTGYRHQVPDPTIRREAVFARQPHRHAQLSPVGGVEATSK